MVRLELPLEEDELHETGFAVPELRVVGREGTGQVCKMKLSPWGTRITL